MQRLPISLLLVACGLAVGCATGAKPDAMAAALVDPPERPAPTVTLRVCGGRSTFPLGSSKISNAAFREAVARSLLEAGLLVPVEDQIGDYHLDVCIEGLQQPNWAFPMGVGLVTDWRLTPRGAGSPLWAETLSLRHTVPFEAEFFGIKRLRLATEGAARDSIAAALVRIAKRLP